MAQIWCHTGRTATNALRGNRIWRSLPQRTAPSMSVLSRSQERIVKSPFPDMEQPQGNLVDLIFKHAHQWGSNTAYECSKTGRTYTYNQLQEAISKFAGFLKNRLGLTKGDVIAIYMPNCAELIIGMLGAMGQGIVASPVNCSYTADELARQLRDSTSKVLVSKSVLEPTVLSCLKVLEKPLPVVMLGTSKIPDIFDYEGILKDAAIPYADTVHFDILHLVPPKVLAKSPQAEPSDLSSIRSIFIGAAPVSPSSAKTFKEKFGQHIIFQEGYGLTETLLTNMTPFRKERIGCCGQLLPNVTAKIIDTATGEDLMPNQTGEVCVKSPMLMNGYYRNEAATNSIIDKEGWLHTGDVGHFDDEGFLKIFDRTKELIKVKAFQECSETGRTYTYNQLQEAISKFAGFLKNRLGLTKGDVIAIYMPNCAELIIGMLGAMGQGIVASPVNSSYTADELARQLRDSTSKVLVSKSVLEPTVLSCLKVLEKPLPVVMLGPSKIPDIFDYEGILKDAAIPYADTVHFDILHLVPPKVLAKSPQAEPSGLSSIRSIFIGAAPVSPSSAKTFKEKFGQHIIFQEGYGLTETLLTNMTPFRKERIGCCGQLLPNVTAKIIDTATGEDLMPNQTGEVCVKSPMLMNGYYRNEAATNSIIDKEGWLHTGDVGHFDDEGFLKIFDRTKELIKVKAFQVSPSELEDVLRKQPDVLDVGVVGVPHDRFGEAPRVYIVGKGGISEEDIHRYMEDKVAPHKRLAGGVVFVKELPKTPTGKLLRRMLN